MNRYNHFKVATYIHAYDLAKTSESEMEQRLNSFCDTIHVDKVYIENHRGKVDIPIETLTWMKRLCEKYHLETAGGITCTQYVNQIRKPAIYDTFCYTDPAHRKECLRIAKELACVFDEIILDDFFFTSCRCEMCIDAKGSRSWKEYRLNLMEEYAKVLVDETKKVNPDLKFVIKFPNWYESYQEAGFYPEKEKDIFDGIYTGTETRTTDSAQHLQRYASYSIMRLMENTAPGRNGGGWVDLFGSLDNPDNLFEQMEATLLGGAKEIMLWNFEMYSNYKELPKLAEYFHKVDKRLSITGKPVGVPVWEPFNGDAEEQVYNYLGMCGASFNTTPYFCEDAPTIFCSASTAEDLASVEKLKTYVRNGGTAVVTLGYYRAVYDKGIRDFSSVTLTSRHVIGKKYRIQNANYFDDVNIVDCDTPVLYEVINYKTNSTHCDISVMAGDCNFPVMTEDNYGKGRFFILNIPDNFADLYKLPEKVLQTINKHISIGLPVYIGSKAKCGMYLFDNETFVLRSYDKKVKDVKVILRGENRKLVNAETNDIYTDSEHLPSPSFMPDCTTLIDDPEEYAYTITLQAGESLILKYE